MFALVEVAVFVSASLFVFVALAVPWTVAVIVGLLLFVIVTWKKQKV